MGCAVFVPTFWSVCLLVGFDLDVMCLIACVYGLPGLLSVFWFACGAGLVTVSVVVIWFVLSDLRLVICLGVLGFGDLLVFELGLAHCRFFTYVCFVVYLVARLFCVRVVFVVLWWVWVFVCD